MNFTDNCDWRLPKLFKKENWETKFYKIFKFEIFKYCVTKFFLFLVDDKDDGYLVKLSDDDYRVMCCPIDFAEAYKQASGITEVDLHRDHRISAALDIT